MVEFVEILYFLAGCELTGACWGTWIPCC